VYIDSDCIFKDTTKKLENFIKPYLNNDVIFLNDKPWYTHMPNSGFYICKVCDNTKQFITDWYNVNIPEKNYHHAWEQCALFKICKNYNIAVVDSMMFLEEEGQFLRHIYSAEKNIRIPYFKNFIELNNINYNENILNIYSVDYDSNHNDYFNNNSIINKSFIWNEKCITFLPDGIINNKNGGYYILLNDYTLNIIINCNEYRLEFNKEYTEFTSIKKNDNIISKGITTDKV